MSLDLTRDILLSHCNNAMVELQESNNVENFPARSLFESINVGTKNLVKFRHSTKIGMKRAINSPNARNIGARMGDEESTFAKMANNNQSARRVFYHLDTKPTCPML
jgi:hypothetical protein